nr:branched-chain amino acid ABC transporter substrate-binding protein [Noviherbaspirillum galbum]
MHAASAEVIKIAQIEPMSGPLAAAGQVVSKHMMAVAAVANEQKWAGNNSFEIVPFDNKGSPQESLALLKSAIDQGYRYVAQGIGSGAALALLDAINKHNARNPGKEVVLLNYYALDPDMTNSKCSFWHFRFDANSDMRVEALTTVMAKDPKIKKVYLINQNYAYGQQVRDAAKEYLKRKRPDIQIVGDDLHPIGQVKDFSPYAAKIKASGADTVLTGNWGNDFAFLVKAAKEMGVNVDFYGVQASGAGVATTMGASGVGHVSTSVGWHANNETFSGSKIVEDYKKKYNEDFSSIGPYNMIAMMSEAVKVAKGGDPVKVAMALEGMKVQGLNGELAMRASDHQLQQPLYIIGWVKTNGKDVKYDLESTGYGWKTLQKVDSYVATQPSTCQMKRPSF